MYAVIDDQGKQYKVREGDELRVDLKDVDAGELLQFNRVLMIGGNGGARLGRPQVPGARVLAEVLRHEKGPKLTMMRFQAKGNRQAKKGHRQKYTRIVVREIHPE
jgi:large subunit ribosomal protein L21